jgi:hypothetical protein
MSNLRLFGLVFGIIGLIATFLLYRGPKWNRFNFIFFSLFNLSLIVVTANPDSINFLRDFLALQEHQRGRLLALLILSNIFLMFFSFYSRSRIENLHLQFDKLIRRMGVATLEEARELEGEIKPIMVVIPAFNEAENLEQLLRTLPKTVQNLELGVIVVDDGSDDDTAAVARNHGCLTVSNIINRGGGATLRLGYDILKSSTAKICITMDADCQHRPEDMVGLIGPLLTDKYDLVIGSRILGAHEKDSLLRISGVYLFGWVISLLLGVKITDPSSGYRAFRLDIMNAIDLVEDQYHTSELIIAAARSKVRIGEAPITIRRRQFGQSKKGKDIKYALNFTRAIVKTWWR